jgi:hypothetical protein
MELFKLKKATKHGQCEAMRCVDEPTPEAVFGALWGLTSGVSLCVKHYEMARSYAVQSDRQLPFKEADSASTAIVPVSEEIVGFRSGGLQGWLVRVHEVLQALGASATEAKSVVEVAKSLTVEDQASLSDVAEWATAVKAKLKDVVALEKEITAPLATAIARLRELVKPAKQGWTDAEHLLRAHLEAAALRQAEHNRALAVEVQSEETVGKLLHTSDLSGVSLKLRWQAVVEDVSKLPDEFVTRIPNLKKLKEHCAAAGENEPEPIPGVRFERAVDSRIQAAK